MYTEKDKGESRQDDEGHVSLKCIIRFIKFLVVISCCKNPFLIYDLVYIQFEYCIKVSTGTNMDQCQKWQ